MMNGLKHKKNIAWTILFILVVVAVFYLVYSTIDEKDHTRIRSREDYILEVETPGKTWLNGHLGIFFRFKSLGNVQWLLIPLLAWFLFSKRVKRERWQLATLLAWLGLVVFIGMKGFENARYQLTFIPFNTVMLFYLLWRFLENKKRGLKIIAVFLIGLASVFNVVNYLDNFRFYWNLRVSVAKPHFPYKLVNYLRRDVALTGVRKKVYVINQPIYYYYLRKRGIDYQSPYMVEPWVLLQQRVNWSGDKAFRLFKNVHFVDYILLSSIQKRFYRSIYLEEFLACDCQLVLEDNNWLLYQLREKSLTETIASEGFKGLEVWNGDKPTVETISPGLVRLFRRGIYRFDVKESNGRKFLEVRNTRSKGASKRIHFGYEFNQESMKMEIPEGKYIHFIVRTSISEGLNDGKNSIIIADFKGGKDWEQEKTVFSTHRWRTYWVSKKIREGSQRLLVYFCFSPKTSQDVIRVQDVKIVISEEPL